MRGAFGAIKKRWDVVTLLCAYALTRIWAAVFISRAAQEQAPSIWTGPHSGYFDMAQLWDGQWYKIIAEQGYPHDLPVDAAGIVQQNPWAFFPGFPVTAHAVMTITGLPFAQAAVLLNVIVGGCAVFVIMRLIQRVAGRETGLWAAVLLCAFPAAPALQIAYSESLALLLLGLALRWLIDRRYGACAVAVLLLALTRPIVAPFAIVVLVHLVLRWRRRKTDAFTAAQRGQVVVLGLFAAASSFIWPALVGLFVGQADAYEQTQSAWRTGGVIQPFQQAVGISHVLWGDRGPWYLVAGAVVLIAIVLSPAGRRIGPELGAWSLAYLGYLLAVTEPWTSTFRYLLMAFPVLAIVSVALRLDWLRARWPSARWLSAGLLAVLAVAGLRWQVHWINDLLLFHPPTDYPP